MLLHFSLNLFERQTAHTKYAPVKGLKCSGGTEFHSRCSAFFSPTAELPAVLNINSLLPAKNQSLLWLQLHHLLYSQLMDLPPSPQSKYGRLDQEQLSTSCPEPESAVAPLPPSSPVTNSNKPASVLDGEDVCEEPTRVSAAVLSPPATVTAALQMYTDQA